MARRPPPSTQPPDLPFSRPVDRATLTRATRPIAFDEVASEAERDALTGLFDIVALPKLRFHGTLTPEGTDGWRLDATLGMTVVQACVVTLADVKTRVDTPVTRIFRKGAEVAALDMDPDADDEMEPLGDVIDLGHVATEAAALALPDYPRAEGAALPAQDTDDTAEDGRENPFAALAALKGRLPEQ